MERFGLYAFRRLVKQMALRAWRERREERRHQPGGDLARCLHPTSFRAEKVPIPPSDADAATVLAGGGQIRQDLCKKRYKT